MMKRIIKLNDPPKPADEVMILVGGAYTEHGWRYTLEIRSWYGCIPLQLTEAKVRRLVDVLTNPSGSDGSPRHVNLFIGDSEIAAYWRRDYRGSLTLDLDFYDRAHCPEGMRLTVREASELADALMWERDRCAARENAYGNA